MVATWGWRVATISGVQLPWNVDQAVSKTHELRQVSAGQCVGQQGQARGTALALCGAGGKGRTDTNTNIQTLQLLHRHLHGPEESTRSWESGNHMSSDTVQKSKRVGEKFGDGISPMTQFKSKNELGKNLGTGSLWWHSSEVKASSATGTLLGPRGQVTATLH